MLDGLLRVEEALRAGLTSSPDFFRINEGFTGRSSSSSASSSSLVFADVPGAGEPNLLRGKSMKALASVLDLECDILRAESDKGGRWSMLESVSFGLMGISIRGPGRPSVDRAFFVSSLACISGEPERCCSMIRIAACSSARSATSLPRPLLLFGSSSLEEWAGEWAGEPVETVVASGPSNLAFGLRELLSFEIWLASSSLSECLGSMTVVSAAKFPTWMVVESEIEGLRRCFER